MKIIGVCILVFMVGCAPSMKDNANTIISKYDAIVYEDGIDSEEAMIIGQRALIKKQLAGNFDINNPKLLKDVSDLPNYEKYWFVVFNEKKLASIEYIFVTLINKETGRLKFADDIQEGKKWILEAVLVGG